LRFKGFMREPFFISERRAQKAEQAPRTPIASRYPAVPFSQFICICRETVRQTAVLAKKSAASGALLWVETLPAFMVGWAP
jgi:hypothetical protein